MRASERDQRLRRVRRQSHRLAQIPHRVADSPLRQMRLATTVVSDHRIGAQRDRAAERLEGGVAIARRQRALTFVEVFQIPALPAPVVDGRPDDHPAGRDQPSHRENRQKPPHAQILRCPALGTRHSALEQPGIWRENWPAAFGL